MQEKYRLKKNYQFNYIFRNGRAANAAHLTLIFAKNNNGKLKVGFSVGKKNGKATKRNKLKRRLKECFRLALPHADKNYNYIFIPRPTATEATYAEICSSVLTVLKKAGLYGEKI